MLQITLERNVFLLHQRADRGTDCRSKRLSAHLLRLQVQISALYA